MKGLVLENELYIFFRTGKSVRCMLDRHEDMLITGGRNPFLCHYRVGFNEHGQIQALDVSVYNNGGSSRDLSAGVSTYTFLSNLY